MRDITTQAWDRVRELEEEVRALGGRVVVPGLDDQPATLGWPQPSPVGWRGRDASSLEEAEHRTAWLLVERDRLKSQPRNTIEKVGGREWTVSTRCDCGAIAMGSVFTGDTDSEYFEQATCDECGLTTEVAVRVEVRVSLVSADAVGRTWRNK
jgi:hypothetical protein